MNRQNCVVYCIRILILYITCRQAWSVRSYRSSNEYQQYVKYLEFHRDYAVENIIKSDAIGNETSTTVITHDIIISRIHQCNCERLNYCGEETVTFFNHHIPLFWHTTPNTSTAPTSYKSKFFTNIEQSAWYKANIDCHYEVVDRQSYRIIQHSDVLLLDIHFQLIQSQCINYTRPLLGGSSFEIVMENELSFVSCSVIDKFDNTYDVNCTIPFAATTGNSIHRDTRRQTNRRSGRGRYDQVNSLSDSIDVSTGSDHNKSLMCFNVTVTLDYEHYSAFTDSKLTPVKLRHHILNARSICRQLSSSRDPTDYIHPRDDDLRGYFIKHPPLEHRSHDLGDDADHHQGHHQSYHSYYYLSDDRIFLDKHAIARCFNDSHPLFMLGNYNCPRCM
jgi:hypothetical protein